MRRPPLWAAAGAEAQKQNIQSNHSAFPPSPQPAPLDRLHLLGHYRRALNRWNFDGGADPMPQPNSFGLRLPALLPSEVLWRIEGGS